MGTVPRDPGYPLDSAQKQAAQEIPRRMAGFIAGKSFESRQTGPKNREI
jgi:hypothetical protein